MKTKTQKRKVGDLGEQLAARFLSEKGYTIVETNYQKKWGEIDIVAQKGNEIHFVEVKSSVSSETSEYRPEENIRSWKKERMARAIKTYLLDRNISDETDIVIDVIAVLLDFNGKKAKIRFIQNVIFD